MNLFAAALVAAATTTVPQPGSHVLRDANSGIDFLRPPAVVDCDPGRIVGTIVVGVRFTKASRAGSVRAQTGRLHGFMTSETSYWLRSEIGGGWHYKTVHGHCGMVNFLNYRIGRRKPGVHRAVRLRVRVRAAA